MRDTLPLITYIPMPEKLPDKIDLTRCIAFKSKKDKQQCPCRHRPGSRFCGKHAQTNQEILANGTRRSARRTLLAPGNQIKSHKHKINTSTTITSQQINKTQINNQNNNQNNHNKPTDNHLNLKNNNNQQKQLIFYHRLAKDPHLSKLTSQQINDNFLFYQLNKYLSPIKKNINQNTNPTKYNAITRDQTTEYKRKALVGLFTLLQKIEYLDPKYENIIKLQQYFRKYKYKIKKYNQGPGVINPMIECINKDDFFSLDPLDTIPCRLLFTYQDTDNFIYGFNLLSFLELLSNGDQPINPYTRRPISKKVINQANRYYRILTSWSKIDEPNILAPQRQQQQQQSVITSGNHIIDSNLTRLSFKDRVKCRLQTIFQKLNYLGYRANIDWLLDKSTPVLLTFIKTLARNWSYQLGFSDIIKHSLLSNTDLRVFESLVRDTYQNSQLNHVSPLNILTRILAVLEPLINNSVDPNSAALLVLYSLYYIEPRRVSLANPWMN